MASTVAVFLHGLDSSIHGTKGSWFTRHFPLVAMWNYQGSLAERLTQLEKQVNGARQLILVGSSFGGLMAACYAVRHPRQCRRLILLAPALNFSKYQPPEKPLTMETLMIIGKNDTVCPPELVLPLARATFSNLQVQIEDDDHLLQQVFPQLPWAELLTISEKLSER
ncbi:MAG: alpha/beta hydrolase [Desulfobulbus propionicus]|nr:MAG: alpha/beta hydrolase [Desulfobulbus propionicus]